MLKRFVIRSLAAVLAFGAFVFSGSTAWADKAFPYVYVANTEGGDVLVIDTATNSIAATIPAGRGGPGPLGGAITPDGSTLYIISFSNSTLWVVDTATNAITTTIQVGHLGSSDGFSGVAPYSVVITPDGSKVYATTGNGVAVIATSTNTVTGTIPFTNSSGAGLAIAPDGSQVYAAVNGQNAIAVIDTATDAISATIPLTGVPSGVAITPDGTKLYVVNGHDRISVIATGTNTVTATIPVSGVGIGIAVTPDGQRVYVANSGDGSLANPGGLAVIATSTDTIVGAVSGFASASAIAITPDGTRAYITSTTSSTTAVVDTQSNRIIKEITGFQLPLELSIFSGPFRSNSSLQVNIAGGGSGSVSSSTGSISCGPVCSASIGTGSSVTLSAQAVAGSVFTGWSGACTGTSDCVVTLSDDTVVTANFSVAGTHALTLLPTGTGTGTVTTDPSGLSCGSSCSANFASGSNVTLKAVAAPGSSFTGWSGGGCSGTDDCAVPLTTDVTVAATFTRAPVVNALSILAAGSGSGIVTSNPLGVSCRTFATAGCIADFVTGSTVTLAASASTGSVFTGWSGGGCSGTTNCTITVTADTTVTANFASNSNTVSLYATPTGTGAGTISSNPSGAFCVTGGSCNTANFATGSTVTLSATPSSGSTFTGWDGGGCSGTGSCTVTMNATTFVTAAFTYTDANATLSVSKVGTGSGSVTGNPSGISCGAICTESFVTGSAVTLTAVPDSGSVFAGWTGACSGGPTCNLSLTENENVAAIFAAAAPTDILSVVFSGGGGGTVTSNPNGVSCTASCAAALNDGGLVTLTATPAPNSTFSGWSGAGCTGFSTCTLTLTSDTSVTATFVSTPANSILSIVENGSGSGTVTSTPSGISCGATCSASFATGSSITLTATSASGGFFNGWSGGGCTGFSPCTVILGRDTTITAAFVSQFPIFYSLSVVKLGAGTGTVTIAPNGVSCGTVCTVTPLAGTPATLSAVADAGSVFTGWSGGGCSGTTPCSLNPTANTTVTATFAPVSETATLSVVNSGGVVISSTPAGVSCGSVCSATFPIGSQISLGGTVTNGGTGIIFNGGGCNGLGVCNIILNADTSVTASAAPPPAPSYTLTVAKAGTGGGAVTTGLNNSPCATPCTISGFSGSSISLTATPVTGSVFTGWSGGGCGIASTCTVTLNADTTVTANFALTKSLTVTAAGTGSGVTTTSPSGITCGATCAAPFVMGSQVTLNASAAQGSMFTGWSGGGCTGTATCVVTLAADTAVTANYALIPTTYMVSVQNTGSGTGTVNSTPSGIACGGTCNASFTIGASLTLTAAPIAGSTFVGWSGGGCSGDQACVATLSTDTTITANFAANVATNINLGAAILPSSRSVQVGSTATLFGTMINSGPGTASNCTVAPATSIPATFFFQTTDSATNAAIGTANTPIDIAQGGAQSFVMGFTPSAAFNPTDVAFAFSCTNANAATSYTGVNTLLLSASATPVSDVVAIGATATNDGTLHIAGTTASGAFAVAVANVGSAGQLSAMADTGAANLPLTLTICQTNPTTAACLSPATASFPTTLGNNADATYSIFANATGTVPFSPAVNRIYVRFLDAGGVTRGSTSIAVTTTQ